MNPAAVLGSLFWSCIWLFSVVVQIAVPLLMYLMVFEIREPWMLIVIVLVAFIAIGVTAGAGGLNSVPSIMWRFKDTIDARIVEVQDPNKGRMYAVRMNFLGAWLWVSAPENNGFVRVTWSHEMCPGNYLSSRRDHAEIHLANLGRFLARGFSVSAVSESVKRATFKRGVLRD